MTNSDEPTIIKKYANRRLYDTGTSTYVTLEDLAEMIKREVDFVVIDAKSREDITRSVLTQIIVEQESKGQYLLPISFLRQLIRFYGDSMQGLVPNFLDHSISSFTRDQDKFREQMSQAIGTGAIDVIEDQVRRNTKMFEQAIKMFSPVSMSESDSKVEANASKGSSNPDGKEKENPELEELQKQLSEMQKKIDKISKNDE